MGLYSFPGFMSLNEAPSGIDTTQVYKNGQLAFTSDGNGYRYVAVDYGNAVDWAAGHPVGFKDDATDFTVNADASEGVIPCGIALDTVDVSAYSSTIWVWIQVSGIALATAADTGIAAGQGVVWSADGAIDHFSDGGEEIVFAHAITQTGTATAAATRILLHIL